MSNFVNRLVQQFKSKSQYQKFVRESQQKFDINTYRFQQLTQAMARKGYNQLRQKYLKNLFQISPRTWHQNQRKLFVWMLLALLKNLKDNNHRIEQEHWQELSETFFQKDILFLKYQYNAVQKNRKKHEWTPQQDRILTSCENHIKNADWNQIAKQIYFQTQGKCFKASKQCRQRWQNHLNSKVSKQQWTPEQDLTILKYVQQNGKKWSKIVQQLKETRTQHMVKNRFKSLISRAQSQLKQKSIEIQTEDDMVQYLINQILLNNPLIDRKSSLQNASQFKDKIQNDLPEIRLNNNKKSLKETLRGCIQRNQKGQFQFSDFSFQQGAPKISPATTMFQSKSPCNLASSLILSHTLFTPQNSTPTPTSDGFLGGSFLSGHQRWNRVFKKGSNTSQASSKTQKWFDCVRKQSNQRLSHQFNCITNGIAPGSGILTPFTPLAQNPQNQLYTNGVNDSEFLNASQFNIFQKGDPLAFSRQQFKLEDKQQSCTIKDDKNKQ